MTLGEEEPLGAEQDNAQWKAKGEWVYKRRKRKKMSLRMRAPGLRER